MNRIPPSPVFVLALAVCGCASTPPPDPEPTTERQSLDRSARLAFSQGQYAQAATLYEATLDEALAEDTPEAIIDARFNLALAQTYLGEYRAALAQITQADAERIRRGLGNDPDLRLLTATIHYRSGDMRQATVTLDPLLSSSSLPPATRAKAHFIAGLIAAEDRDSSALRRHIVALTPDGSPGMEADRLELQGRLAGLVGDTQAALRRLDQAVALRSLDRDYRGMVRTLATAGDLAESTQNYWLAGNYLLRAGRSAAQRTEPEAREWLERARALGVRSGDTALVLEAEAGLDMVREEN